MARCRHWMGLLLVLALSAPAVGHASCTPPQPPQQTLEQSDAVFRGEVTNVGTSTPLHHLFHWSIPVTFRVAEAWKGVTTTRVTLQGHTHPSLAVPFERGQQYLVYAYYGGDQGRGSLTTNGCKGTKRVADAEAELRILGAAQLALEPAPEPASSLWIWFFLSVVLVVLSAFMRRYVRTRLRR